MRNQRKTFGEKIQGLIARTIFIFVSAFFLIACSKQVKTPSQDNSNKLREPINNFHLSESKVVLLQGNASNLAISFSWDALTGKDVKYILEAAIGGSSFEEPVVVASTNQVDTYFKVGDFNSLMCKLLYADRTGRVDFRVRSEWPSHSGKPSGYSATISLDVTTYQQYIEYDERNVLKIPGNYQGWNLATAPKIISTANSGEYEGYVNFTNQYPQLLMVKGNQWETSKTFSYIGADKFGFGGSVMSVFGGTGVYLFKASTNTNKWSYTKIDSWGITGSAVPGSHTTDPVMVANEKVLSWSITTNLVSGSFRIRANNSNAISFGYKDCDGTGIPSYDGDNIVIKKSGNYTIRLVLQLAGNYAYSIQKNS